MPEPIKRHIALQPISREHHHSLLLSWKIRQGLKCKISLERIKAYVDWYWSNYLLDHFKFEEAHIFPILGKEHPMINRVLREHARIKKYILSPNNLEKNLSLVEEELVNHIRFEERILFKEIEMIASQDELEKIQNLHTHHIEEDWHDPFWTSLH